MVDSTPTSSSPRRTARAQRERSRSPLQEKRSRSRIRTPLREKTSSDNNVFRQARDTKPQVDVFSTTPFPTKPQHVLLPSTIRRQQSFQNGENQLPPFIGRGQAEGSQAANPARGTIAERGARRPPVLQLKKSVTTLRDMYEAHERSSRPSTATTSPALRPMSSSSRLRSCSSSEGLSGRLTWGSMHKVSSDDLALLPSLNEMTIRKMESEASFASRMGRMPPLTSSPNYRVLGTSSPKMPVFRDEPIFSSDSLEPSSSSGPAQTSSSSPNFVRLGRSSSIGEGDDMQPTSSSPNFIKLGTSSPAHHVRDSSPTPSVVSNISIQKEQEIDEEEALRATYNATFNSSPPYIADAASSSEQSIQSPNSLHFNSSPPEPVTSRTPQRGTPAFRIPARGSSESFASSHASLQAALSSSPMPPIQYPIVRAPTAVAQNLSVPKRNTRSMQLEGQAFTSRLSPVPSEWEELPSTSRSDDTEGGISASTLTDRELGNESQVRIMTDDHSQEETDELSALPRPPYRSPPMVPMRTNSLYGTLTNSSASNSQSRLNSLRHSFDSRLNSMRSFTISRQNSIVSNSVRPNSSGSVGPNAVVPTWARRYYSGFYRDSFQYLYNPSQPSSATHLPIPQHTLRSQRSHSLIELTREPTQTSSKHGRYSFQSLRKSLRDSISERIPSLIRPRLEARDSHLTMGVGPLVSHPIHPEPALVLEPEPDSVTPTIRRISKGKGRDLLPVDPRAHWAGTIQTNEALTGHPVQQIPRHSVEIQEGGRQSVESASVYYSASATSRGLPAAFRFLPSPHLHQDHRPNTGSSTSRGYGHPFNHKPKFHPARGGDVQPDGYGRPSWHSLDLHSTQVFVFILGFVCPIAWFLGSFLPLPPRPTMYTDLEKAEWDAATFHGTRSVSEWDEIDIVARLRMERHLKGMEEVRWQNARWWRRMNRFMAIVGVVIIVVAVVLAVIATRGGL